MAESHGVAEAQDATATPWEVPPRAVEAVAPPSVVGSSSPRPSRGGWTLVVMCIGIAIIACCIIIPQSDANRILAYQRQQLQADLEQIQKQIAVNDGFLKKVADDPTLAERLAQRQMKVVREGTSILPLKGQGAREDSSPFLLVSVPPPAPQPELNLPGGKLASLCRNPRSRTYLMGVGMMLLAAGLVMGYTAPQQRDP